MMTAQTIRKKARPILTRRGILRAGLFGLFARGETTTGSDVDIIGEAVQHLPKEAVAPSHDIPWSDIVGIRDVLMHEYVGVDVNMVYDTTTNDLFSAQSSRS